MMFYDRTTVAVIGPLGFSSIYPLVFFFLLSPPSPRENKTDHFLYDRLSTGFTPGRSVGCRKQINVYRGSMNAGCL
jgi:hypothetical protein